MYGPALLTALAALGAPGESPPLDIDALLNAERGGVVVVIPSPPREGRLAALCRALLGRRDQGVVVLPTEEAALRCRMPRDQPVAPMGWPCSEDRCVRAPRKPVRVVVRPDAPALLGPSPSGTARIWDRQGRFRGQLVALDDVERLIEEGLGKHSARYIPTDEKLAGELEQVRSLPLTRQRSTLLAKLEAADDLACPARGGGCKRAGRLDSRMRDPDSEASVPALLTAAQVRFDLAAALRAVPPPPDASDEDVNRHRAELEELATWQDVHGLEWLDEACRRLRRAGAYGPPLWRIAARQEAQVGWPPDSHRSCSRSYIALREAGRARPTTPPEALRGARQLRLGWPERAYPLLEAARRARPDDPWTLYNLAAFHYRYGDFEAAEGLFSGLAAAPDAPPDAMRARADSLQCMQRWEEALALLEAYRARTRHPEPARRFFEEALAVLSRARLDRLLDRWCAVASPSECRSERSLVAEAFDRAALGPMSEP